MSRETAPDAASFWRLARLLLSEIPEMLAGLLFWTALLLSALRWGLGLSPWARILMLIIGLAALFGSWRIAVREFRRLRDNERRQRIGRRLNHVRRESGLTESLLSALPSDRDMRTLLAMATDAASTKASDARVNSLILYVHASASRARASAQFGMHSDIRCEDYTYYLPDELWGDTESPGTRYCQKVRYAHDLPHWREAVARAIESASSEIEKADAASAQIAPSAYGPDTGITFTLTKPGRKWTVRYVLTPGELVGPQGVLATYPLAD